MCTYYVCTYIHVMHGTWQDMDMAGHGHGRTGTWQDMDMAGQGHGRTGTWHCGLRVGRLDNSAAPCFFGLGAVKKAVGSKNANHSDLDCLLLRAHFTAANQSPCYPKQHAFIILVRNLKRITRQHVVSPAATH